MPRTLLGVFFVILFGCALALDGPADSAVGEDDRFRTNRSSDVTLSLPDEDRDAFTFAVFGDRTGGPPEGIAILEQAVKDVNLVGPDLVMTVGDLVNGYNTTPDWMLQMTEFRGVMGALDMPWFPVAGNHDVYWRGEGRPALEHEENYERHFGPLWYAFRHKGCWFICLFADETNPDTGRKSFGDAEHQRMSPAQFAWLEETIGATKDARHVFVFLHHPRWTGGRYGNDWDRVHELLVAAGNVTAVFAGHIHRMRYDPKDGIEYFTLATVGGSQAGDIPAAGYLHNYQLVTVRDEGIATTTYPVGTAQDPRKITGEVSIEARRASRELRATAEGLIRLDTGFGGAGEFALTLDNPLDSPVEVWLAPEAQGDPRWAFIPDHAHVVLEPGTTQLVEFIVARPGIPYDAAFRPPALTRRADLLTPELRVPLPDATVPLTVFPSEIEASGVSKNQVLNLDGNDDYLAIPSRVLGLPQGPFTIEAWVRPGTVEGNQGLLCKTESSDYGVFTDGGKPTFLVHLGGGYVSAEAEGPMLQEGVWHHIAGVYDGGAVRLYVDGSLVAATPATGERKTNDLPFVIGGDVNSEGLGARLMKGMLDEVRVSSIARYSGERFERPARHVADEDTVLLLHMETALGPWVRDASGRGAHAIKAGGVGLVASP